MEQKFDSTQVTGEHLMVRRAKKVITYLANKHYPNDALWQEKCTNYWKPRVQNLLCRIKEAYPLLADNDQIISMLYQEIDKQIAANKAKRSSPESTGELRNLKRSSPTRLKSKRTLISSTDGISGAESFEPLSSDELPLGMNNYQFAILCHYMVKHFDKGAFIESDTPYLPPEFLCFKGSSVTGVSYAKEKNQKLFGDHSDYDGILIWEQGVRAVDNLSSTIGHENVPKNLQLDRAQSGLKFLNLHSDDRLEEEKGILAKRRIFPNGVPHILFCAELKSKMHTKHPLNFVVLEKLRDIILKDDLVEKQDNADTLGLNRDYVFTQRRVSEHLNKAYYPHGAKEEEYRKIGQILVYSWRLIKRYNEYLLNDKFGTYDFRFADADGAVVPKKHTFFKTMQKNRMVESIDINQEVQNQLEWVDEAVHQTPAKA